MDDAEFGRLFRRMIACYTLPQETSDRILAAVLRRVLTPEPGPDPPDFELLAPTPQQIHQTSRRHTADG